MAMIKSNSFVHLFSIILWLSLLLLFFGWCNFFSEDINNISHRVSPTSQYHTCSNNRKVLATKFDFTPFLHHQKHHRRHHSRHVPAEDDVYSGPSGNEIDPRYGVEKRLVPTGPNPLHHWDFFFLWFNFSSSLLYVNVIFFLWWSSYLFSSCEKRKKENYICNMKLLTCMNSILVQSP